MPAPHGLTAMVTVTRGEHGARLVLAEPSLAAHPVAPAVGALRCLRFSSSPVGVPFLGQGCLGPWFWSTTEGVEAFHIFPTRSWIWTIFSMSPFVSVSLQLRVLKNFHTFPSIRRENLDIVFTRPSYSAGGTLLKQCLARQWIHVPVTPGFFWTVCPQFLREEELGS